MFYLRVMQKKQELIEDCNFWLWCRWFGHRGSIEEDILEKEDRPDLVIPWCTKCGRVS